MQVPLEELTPQTESYDLVVAATSYHWLNARHRVAIIGDLLKPSGYVALMWNVFGRLHKVDPFHEATKHLLAHLAASPSGAPDAIPFALDRQAREAEFLQDGRFGLTAYLEIQWTLQLNARQVGLLYEGFSSIARLSEPERNKLLQQLMQIADTTFNGLVERYMTSPLYLFQQITEVQ
jgi:SAM-dependent methyltransferase